MARPPESWPKRLAPSRCPAVSFAPRPPAACPTRLGSIQGSTPSDMETAGGASPASPSLRVKCSPAGEELMRHGFSRCAPEFNRQSAGIRQHLWPVEGAALVASEMTGKQTPRCFKTRLGPLLVARDALPVLGQSETFRS